MSASGSRLIVPADATADLVVCEEGLSFWGGVDPETGTVIDAHHPLCGQCLAGKIVLMPTSRGSCSGSGVLLHLALNGCAPAALIFREAEEILTLGALIAAEMFDRRIAVARLAAAEYAALALRSSAVLHAGRLVAEGLVVDLEVTDATALDLTAEDRAILAGETGQAAALAMRVILAMAAAQGAERLIEVTRGHVDGCIYAHDANLIFAETMAEMGARVAIPTTINAISVDRESRCGPDLPRTFSEAANRLADAYLRMGAQPTFTCAPYLSPTPPQRGEAIGWSESNAVIFANSVLGARTAKHPDYFDLFVAMTGRAPESGMYLAAARRPGVVIDIDMPTSHDDAIWPLLGWVAGRLAPDRVPLLRGLEAAAPGRDDLRAMCAAFGTTSAAPMLHVAGVTPESDLDPIPAARRVQVTRRDLAEAWHALNAGPECIDLVALGSPHFSLEETRAFAGVMAGARIGSGVRVIITLGRDVRAEAAREGLLDRLQSVGVRVHADLCWCSMVEPIFPETARAVMTNSGKYAHYAPGLSGRGVRFGSLADCAAAAQSGRAPTEPPEWLR